MELFPIAISFLCIFSASAQRDIGSAEIFSFTTEVFESDTLDLRCGIFHINEKNTGELNMYLCKNGVGIRMKIITSLKEATFSFPDVTKEDSGNYSCVYSKVKYAVQTVTAVGQKSIFIQVKDFGVAHISVGNTHVFQGDDMDVKCIVFEATTQTSLYMYLLKNGTGVSMEVVKGKEAHFTFIQVSKEDSGNYSCVYSVRKFHPGNVTSTNENYISINIEEKDVHQWWVNVIRLLCSAGVVVAAVTVLNIPQFRRGKTKSNIQHNHTSSKCPDPKPSDIDFTKNQSEPRQDDKSETNSTQLCQSAETDF